MAASWTDTDARLLRQLREAARLDRATLARRASLSLAQLADLEDAGDGRAFYSPAIRAHKGQQLLQRLGHEPAKGAEPDPASPPPSTGQADAGAPMALATTAAATRPVRRSRTLQAGLLLLVVLVVALEGAALLSASRREAAQPQAAAAPAAPATPAAPASREDAPMAMTSRHAPAAETPAPAPTQAAASTDCDALQATGAAAVPPQAGHPGDYVHFESDQAFSACVLDAAGRRTRVQGLAGEGATVRGEPPFVVQVADWERVRVFFQGLRVRPPAEAADRALLLQAR